MKIPDKQLQNLESIDDDVDVVRASQTGSPDAAVGAVPVAPNEDVLARASQCGRRKAQFFERVVLVLLQSNVEIVLVHEMNVKDSCVRVTSLTGMALMAWKLSFLSLTVTWYGASRLGGGLPPNNTFFSLGKRRELRERSIVSVITGTAFTSTCSNPERFQQLI